MPKALCANRKRTPWQAVVREMPAASADCSVPVLAYRDAPGDETHLYANPHSVVVALSLRGEPVTLAGSTTAVPRTSNAGQTATHSLFTELNEPRRGAPRTDATLGPSAS
ncbi:hypothetical protein [Streptomyces sp. NPDC001139]